MSRLRSRLRRQLVPTMTEPVTCPECGASPYALHARDCVFLPDEYRSEDAYAELVAQDTHRIALDNEALDEARSMGV